MWDEVHCCLCVLAKKKKKQTSSVTLSAVENVFHTPCFTSALRQEELELPFPLFNLETRKVGLGWGRHVSGSTGTSFQFCPSCWLWCSDLPCPSPRLSLYKGVGGILWGSADYSNRGLRVTECPGSFGQCPDDLNVFRVHHMWPPPMAFLLSSQAFRRIGSSPKKASS